MTRMAILQEVDKCMRCNGCVISCKRTWQMVNETIGVHRTAYDQRVAIKSQKNVDMGPFVRFSCWHCPDPPCVPACPLSALAKQENGAVSIDPTVCNPAVCNQECVAGCHRGGFPKIGIGSEQYPTAKAWKCTMCWGRAGDVATYVAADPTLTAKYGQPLPTRATTAQITACAERAHEPSCVYTCPAKAMRYEPEATVWAEVQAPANGYVSCAGGGGGSVIWASKKYFIAQPKADPLMEDHLSPMVSELLAGPFAKAAAAATLVAGGLLAIGAAKAKNASKTEGSVD